jgi:SET domain-containing protein
MIIYIVFLFTLLLYFCLFHCTNNNYQIIEDYDDDNFYIHESNVHGVGVFTKNNLKKDEKLFQVLKGTSVLPLAKKVNHCQKEKSNSYVKQDEFDKRKWFLYASKDINSKEEIVSDYNDAPSQFIQRPNKEWKC